MTRAFHQTPTGVVHLQRHVAVIFVVGSIGLITLLHYLTNAHWLPYHSIYRSLYYLPIGVAAVVWGLVGGLMTAGSIAMLYVPHAVLMAMPPDGKLVDNLLEVLSMLIVASFIGSIADGERRHRQQIEALQASIQAVLASLPVGVATLDPDAGLRPLNDLATTLLTQLPPQAIPPTQGYGEYLHGSPPVAIRRSDVYDGERRQLGEVVVIEDLSEQQRLSEHIRRTERLAALGQLAGGLAHEVRNPLAIVRATTQLLRRKLDAVPTVQDHLRILTVETDRIDRLIGEVLTYAHPRQPTWETVAIDPFMDELLHALEPVATQYQVRMITHIPSSRILVHLDPEYFRQALLNVMLNAMQASQPDQAIHITWSSDATTLTVWIDDYGVGIPGHLRARIFDPFFTTRDTGTGMGLAVVARIISEHHGTIHLDARPQGGTRTAIRIPLCQDMP